MEIWPVLIMKVSLKGLLLLSFLGVAITRAQCLEITIDNHTDATVVMAFSYLDNKENDWVVDGWDNVMPRQLAKVDLDSKNDIYYLYSEFSNGKKLEGGSGSVELQIFDRSFFYLQKKPAANYDRKVSFLRARGNEGKALIKIK